MKVTKMSISVGRTVSHNYNSLRTDISLTAEDENGFGDFNGAYTELRDTVIELVDDALERADDDKNDR